MATTQLIVCEAGSTWAVALRRQLAVELRETICETRSLTDCWRQALAASESIVILELTRANLELCASELLRYRTRLPRVPVLVVGSRDVEAAGPLMRELGAVHTVFSTRDVMPLVRIVQRHWRRVHDPDAIPPWRQLPWEDASGAGILQLNEPEWLADERS